MSETVRPSLLRGALDYGEQDENGIDLSLIRSNLKLTPWERICRGDAARRQALMLQEYGRRHREKTAASTLR